MAVKSFLWGDSYSRHDQAFFRTVYFGEYTWFVWSELVLKLYLPYGGNVW